jgi:tetratricopeptide (TPR) repeat protein
MTERARTRDRWAGSGSGLGGAVGDSTMAAVREQTRAQQLQSEARHQTLGSRLMEHRQRVGTRTLAPQRWDSGTRLSVGVQASFGTSRPLYLHGRYYDRPDLIRYADRHIYTYYDPYHRLHHQIIWPTYYYPLYYPFGPYVSVGYVWPYYQRKYVFVSLGGWWPSDYCYLRYYWYGWHPYLWYGYYPVASEVAAGGDNYYTYNFYGDDGSYATYSSSTPVDQSTLAAVRAKLEQKNAAPPAPQTLADTRFDEGVKSFEAGDYHAAVTQFAAARALSPQDVILPFAQAQALFADGQYDEAAVVLRQALQNTTPEQEGVFFPRGLYANDDVLFGQIEKLLDKADQTDDPNLQLLLGYQLLGVGETGYAREQLEQARQDPSNAEAAGILLNVVEKLEKEAGPAVKAGGAADATGPAGTVSGEGMSAAQTIVTDTGAPTAGPEVPAGATPAGISPATARQDESEPPETGRSQTAPEASADLGKSILAPAPEPAQSPENTAPAQHATPPAEKANDPGGVGTVSKDGVAADKAGFFESTPGVALVPALSWLTGEHTPNYKADIGIFASILALALAGLWIEWRFLDRTSV